MPFDELPKKEDFVEVDDKEMKENEISWTSQLALIRALEKEEFKYNTIHEDLLDHGGIACDLIPDELGLGVPNPFEIGCWIALFLSTIQTFVVWLDLAEALQILQYAYQDATISDAQVYDAYLFSKANYENSMTLYPWVVDSFGIVNRNMIQQHMQMTTVLAEQHEALEIRLNTYMMCMTNHLGISMLEINYPDAAIDGLSLKCKKTLGLVRVFKDGHRRSLVEVSETAPSQAPSSSDAPTISQSLPDIFTFSVEFEDGTVLTSSDPIEEEQGSDDGNEEGSGSNPTTAGSSSYMSQYEMIKQIYQTMNSTDSSSDQGQDETDTGVSTSAKWYVDWVSS